MLKTKELMRINGKEIEFDFSEDLDDVADELDALVTAHGPKHSTGGDTVEVDPTELLSFLSRLAREIADIRASVASPTIHI
jgi:hypothetical protein